jgi:hypothetical protein
MKEINKIKKLSSHDINIIKSGEWLEDTHMDTFGKLLKNCSSFCPRDTWKIQHPDTIEPITLNEQHIQILHSSTSAYDGHWVCSYYNNKTIYIYDSLNHKQLHAHHELYLKKLCPFLTFNKNTIKFPNVQQQPNQNDCGVFAIAFAVSLLFNLKPNTIKYEHSIMRQHLIKIFETNIIEHFPQNLTYGLPKQVLPLAVIENRRKCAYKKRVQRYYETEEQHQVRLEKQKIYNKTKKNNVIKIMSIKGILNMVLFYRQKPINFLESCSSN